MTQGKIRGPDIIESRVAPQTITTTLYSIQCIRLLILQLQLPLLLLLLCKLPTTALRKASPLSYSVTVIERVLTSTREQFSKNTKTSAGQKVSRFSFPQFLASFPVLEIWCPWRYTTADSVNWRRELYCVTEIISNMRKYYKKIQQIYVMY